MHSNALIVKQTTINENIKNQVKIKMYNKNFDYRQVRYLLYYCSLKSQKKSNAYYTHIINPFECVTSFS